MRTADLLTTLTALAVLTAAPARAQDAPPAQQPPAQPAAGQQTAGADSAAAPADSTARPNDPQLVFEREVFAYGGSARRDPFRPLTGLSAGPLFEDLELRLILFDPNPDLSIVELTDPTGEVYRLRRGDTAGNATVVDIAPRRVTFSVVDFGVRRVEVLNLNVTREGA